jgi:hypothetical protein
LRELANDSFSDSGEVQFFGNFAMWWQFGQVPKMTRKISLRTDENRILNSQQPVLQGLSDAQLEAWDIMMSDALGSEEAKARASIVPALWFTFTT